MMTGRERADSHLTPALYAHSSEDGAFDGNNPERREIELRRMAAFRVRETANRIATLANSAQNEELRRDLLAICQRLLAEERLLLGSQ